MPGPRVRSEAFVDLVVADEQWLRTEFDAIIAASFDEPPRSRPPVRRRAAYPRLPAGDGEAVSAPGSDGNPPRRPWRRQRSPPLTR